MKIPSGCDKMETEVINMDIQSLKRKMDEAISKQSAIDGLFNREYTFKIIDIDKDVENK